MNNIITMHHLLLLLLASHCRGQEGSGGGDTLEASGAAEVSEVEGSAGEAAPVTVEHSVPYTMTSADGSLTVRKVLLQFTLDFIKIILFVLRRVYLILNMDILYRNDN